MIKIPKVWSFKNLEHKAFISHIQKSVPGFDDSHELIKSLAPFFLQGCSKYYDLGCSFGNLIFSVFKSLQNKKTLCFGVDIQPKMIVEAKKIAKKLKLTKNCKFYQQNLKEVSIRQADLITCLYTLQFVNPRDRQDVLKKIYHGLNWGGGLILFEKVRGPDARFQDILTTLYNEYKIQQGLSAKSVIDKTKSLKGILEPFSEAGNLGLLKRAGFKDIMTIRRELCFHGWLCIK